MPKFPDEPHLYAYRVNGSTKKIVRAASVAEARDYMASLNKITFDKLTPAEAFVAASEGVELLEAKPEYEGTDERITAELFGPREYFDVPAGHEVQLDVVTQPVSHDSEVHHAAP